MYMYEFPKVVDEILVDLNAKGYEAYCVGGFVRDTLLKRQSFDVDITTNAPLSFLTHHFESYHPQVHAHFGNLTFNLDPYKIEITQYRQESHYDDQRHPSDVLFGVTLDQDLARRDFTINAILYNPQVGIIDRVGGIDALKKRRIEVIGDPHIRFQEDLLRMLRAVRFAAELNFEIEPKALAVLKTHFNLLRNYSPRQWQGEFFKFLMAPHFYEWVSENPWILGTLILELEATVAFEQENPYHNRSLYLHTVVVTSQLTTLNERIAGLFHDLGKLHTQTFENGVARYPRHALASVEILNRYLEAWNLSKKDCKLIRDYVIYHDLSIPMDELAIVALVQKHGLGFIRTLVKFKRADNSAKSDLALYQLDKCDAYDAILDQLENKALLYDTRDLEITGQDLVDVGVVESKRKYVLRMLLDLVNEKKIENNQEALMEALGRIVSHDLY